MIITNKRESYGLKCLYVADKPAFKEIISGAARLLGSTLMWEKTIEGGMNAIEIHGHLFDVIFIDITYPIGKEQIKPKKTSNSISSGNDESKSGETLENHGSIHGSENGHTKLDIKAVKGLTFLKELRDRKDLNGTAICIISSESLQFYVNLGVKIGADEYIKIAVTTHRILDTLRRWAKLKSIGKENLAKLLEADSETARQIRISSTLLITAFSNFIDPTSEVFNDIKSNMLELVDASENDKVSDTLKELKNDGILYQRSIKVSAFMYYMGITLKCFSEEEIKEIFLGSLLHNIGYVGMDISQYSSRILTAKQIEALMATQFENAQKYIQSNPNKLSEIAEDIILYHGEYIDGSGRLGKKEEDIPKHAQMAAVVVEYWSRKIRYYRVENQPSDSKNIIEDMRNSGKFNSEFVEHLALLVGVK